MSPIVHSRGNSLIYSKGSGTDSSWSFIRPSASQYIDDVYDWGQVLRLTASDINGNQVVDESNLVSGHYQLEADGRGASAMEHQA